MTTPYITPSMLINNAPFGIDWSSIPSVGASDAANLAALYDICLCATSEIDTFLNMALRATADIEQLDGPDQRLSVRQTSGVGLALMQHWPILEVIGAQYTPAGSFPRNWSPIPANMMEPQEPTSQFVGSSAVPGGSGDGMNGIIIAPGYIDWTMGRFGFTVQIAYLNGWPMAGLTTNCAADATTLLVDDVTGMAGSRPIIWDGANTETVTVTAGAAASPVEILPDVYVQAGPGTLTLASGTQYAHTGTTPAQCVVSAMPSVVREAAYYFASAEAMQRGATAISVPALPGSVMTGGQPSIASFKRIGQMMIRPLGRVI